MLMMNASIERAATILNALFAICFDFDLEIKCNDIFANIYENVTTSSSLIDALCYKVSL